MATTTNYGWDTPDDTDLVKDGASAIRTLGSSVDTTTKNLNPQTTTGALAYRSATANVNTALPVGSTGQVLTVASGVPSWATPTTGDITEVTAGVGISIASGTGPIPVITNSSTDLITTAGDLLYGSAADTMVRLGIGSTGNVLTVASGVPSWAAPASGVTFAGASVSNVSTSSVSVADSTSVSVTFDTEQYDTDAYHSTATNTSRFTIPAGKAGKYLLTGRFRWDSNTTGSRFIIFSKNGSAYDSTGSAVYASMYQIHTVVLDLAVADYVELQGFQDSGGTRTINTNQVQSRFTISYLGA